MKCELFIAPTNLTKTFLSYCLQKHCLFIPAGVVCFFLVAGCATQQPLPSSEQRLQLGTLGVTAVGSTPNVDFHSYARGWASGVAKGGATGFAEGLLQSLVEAAQHTPTGPYAAPAMLITTIVLATTGTIVSGVVGGLEAVPTKTAEEAENRLRKTLGDVSLAGDLAGRIVESATQRADIAHRSAIFLGVASSPTEEMMPQWQTQHVDTVVEVQLTDAGFHGASGAHPIVSFYMNVRIRLLKTRPTEVIFTRDFQYLSRKRPVADWFTNGSRALTDSFSEALQVLAERIVDELFIVTRFPFDSGYWALPGQQEFGSCWFQPLYPKVRYTSLWDSIRKNQPGIRVGYTEIDSLQPTLKWESFPRPRDRKEKNNALLAQITDVTYDLKLWEAPDEYPERLVLDVSGLTEPRYSLSNALKPRTRYFWTFRARYRLAGHPSVTRWAFSSIPANVPGEYPQRPAGGNCDLDAIPSTNYFRFATH